MILGSLGLLACLLPSQVNPTWVQGRDSLVHEGRILRRQAPSGRLGPVPGLPPVPAGSPASPWKGMAWDGEFLYQWGSVTEEEVQLRFAFPQESASGAQWFWSTPIRLPAWLRPLAFGSRMALAEERGFKDEQGTTHYRVHSVDLIGGDRRVLFSRRQARGRVPGLFGQALYRDQAFYLLLSSGDLYVLPPGASSLKREVEAFWPKVSENIVLEGEGPFPGLARFPPRFAGPAFFGAGGDLLFPLVVREKNEWSPEAMERLVRDEEAAFANLPKDVQLRRIASGHWPPRADRSKPFKGSEEVFLVLRYEPESRKLGKVAVDRLGNLVRKHPYTGQCLVSESSMEEMLKAGLLLGEDTEGRIVPLDELIQAGGASTPAGARVPNAAGRSTPPAQTPQGPKGPSR